MTDLRFTTKAIMVVCPKRAILLALTLAYMFLCVVLDVGNLALGLVLFAICSALLLLSGKEIENKSIALYSEYKSGKKITKG